MSCSYVDVIVMAILVPMLAAAQSLVRLADDVMERPCLPSGEIGASLIRLAPVFS